MGVLGREAVQAEAGRQALAVSPDGKYLAYSTAASGSDWNEIKVRDIDSGTTRSLSMGVLVRKRTAIPA